MMKTMRSKQTKEHIDLIGILFGILINIGDGRK